jgi:glucan phosphoethanolaminetransferase (alkaline phosphatase superfamily)
MPGRSARTVRFFLGDRPRAVLLFTAPTAMAIALDVALRARSLAVFPPREWLNYFGSSLASLGFWSGPLWFGSRLFTLGRRARIVGVGLFSLLFVFPLALFCFGGQLLYFHVFHAYMARDTVRLGIALRGTLGAWLASWGASVVLMALIGLAFTAAILAIVRRAALPVKSAWPVVPVLGFSVAAYCFWIDFVESRSLQAAPPDTCFIHGFVHAIRDGVTGKGWAHRGIAERDPTPLPKLTAAPHRPNVVLIVTESVRVDAMCSAPAASCRARFLDEAAPDRISLGRLTMQSSGTFTSCVLLWTGLGPEADFWTLHHAPVLWEVARAVGYRTAYIGSQNLRYDNFGAFLTRAGIDVEVGAADLGDAADAHVGAPDENATLRMLSFVRDGKSPYFAVLHLSNTHWPYRVDPQLQPYLPHDDTMFGDTQKLHNHYRNSVLLQERTVASFVKDLRGLPGWDDTVVLFLSDHGEEFREHGGLYHLTTVFDEEVRVPGWLVAGASALDAGQRAALASYAGRRTYTEDVHATLMDLLGVLDQPGLPFADRTAGRSLLRAAPAEEPLVLLSTGSGVWEPDVTRRGVMQGDMLAVSSDRPDWQCFDTQADPGEVVRQIRARCKALIEAGNRRFDWTR